MPGGSPALSEWDEYLERWHRRVRVEGGGLQRLIACLRVHLMEPKVDYSSGTPSRSIPCSVAFGCPSEVIHALSAATPARSQRRQHRSRA